MTRLARWFSLALIVGTVAQAATITIDGRDFSAPISKTILVVRTATTQWTYFQGVGTFTLPDGTFIVSLYAGAATYGGFTIAGGVITATTGALTQTGPTSVAALPSALTPVDLDVGPLSVPAGLETVVLSTGAAGVGRHTGAASARFFLPDATYKLATYSGHGTFGTFVVQGGAVSNPTGSLTVSGSTVGFDRALLAPVRVGTSALTSSPALAVTVRVTDPEGIAVLNGNDPLLYLPDGSYGLKTYSTRAVFGTFAVTNRQVSTVTGALTRTVDGVGFERALLVPATFSLASLTTPAGGVLYRVSEAPGEGYIMGFGDGTAWFPPGNFVVTDYSTTRTLATLGLTLGNAPTVTGGLQLAAGLVTPRPCGLAVLDLYSPTLATLRDYTSNFVAGARRVSVPPGSYAFVTNTLAPLANLVVSPSLQVTVSNLAAGASVSAVSCVQDQDGDGVDDPSDNCPAQANASQANQDGDALGDVCDADLDGDGFPNASDVCPQLPDAQADLDLDGLGDACDADDDGDGVSDALDVCPLVANADQVDQDLDGLGNACDPDLDGDGAANGSDRCPLIADDQADLDGDGVGDACDDDDDGDDVPDASDNCLGRSNVDQLDADADGQGNACDADDDADGVADVSDNCALVPNASQLDFDGDGLGDACDADGDGDGVLTGDLCPATSAGVPIDVHGCGGVERVAQRCVQGTFPNHGQYVSCVARESQAAVVDGLLTETERARLVAQAAKKR